MGTPAKSGNPLSGVTRGRIPPGPQAEFKATDDLLEWMGGQFQIHGNTFKASIYGTSVYVTRDPEFAHHVLVENWQNYVKGQIIERVALLLGMGLMVSEGELWKRQRRMAQPAFSHDSIASLTKQIAAVSARLLGKWQLAARTNDSVNVTRDVSSMALEVMLRFILGEDYEQIAPHFDLLTEERTRDMAFVRTFRPLGKILLQLVDRRRKKPPASNDALNVLMQARDPQSGQCMRDNQLIDEILTLVVAGHETTASTLNWAWYLLSQHPDVEQKLFRELDSVTNSFELDDLSKFSYTRQVIDETMRLYPAGWIMTRRALHDDRLGDYFVPAGIEIYIPSYYIQRHLELWDEPERFDPDRFLPENSKNRHRLATIPFSAGPRNCIGALFARVEMQIHIMTISRSLRLRYVASKPMEIDAGVNLRSKYDLSMYPEVRGAGKVRAVGSSSAG